MMPDTDTLSERLIREIIEGCEGVTPGPWSTDEAWIVCSIVDRGKAADERGEDG